MLTQSSARSFEFARVEALAVVAAFDGGAVTSDAGSLFLGATDRAIRAAARFAGCFADHRRADLIEHDVSSLVGQRKLGIALGSEDLNDHDELRHDPVMARLVGKLEASPRTARRWRTRARTIGWSCHGMNRRDTTRSATIRRRSRFCVTFESFQVRSMSTQTAWRC